MRPKGAQIVKAFQMQICIQQMLPVPVTFWTSALKMHLKTHRGVKECIPSRGVAELNFSRLSKLPSPH